MAHTNLRRLYKRSVDALQVAVSSFCEVLFVGERGWWGLNIQSVTTILEDFSNPLNCADEAIWTVLDILNREISKKGYFAT